MKSPKIQMKISKSKKYIPKLSNKKIKVCLEDIKLIRKDIRKAKIIAETLISILSK